MSNPAPAVEPNIFGIVCGACQWQHREGVTTDDVRDVLDTHAECVAASVEFAVTVPAAMADPPEQAYDAWNRQADREGYRMAAVPQIENPAGREAVVRGYVVPVGFRKWVPLQGDYVEPSE